MAALKAAPVKKVTAAVHASPAKRAPVEKVTGKKTPAKDVPVKHAPVKHAPAKHVPVAKVVGKAVPATSAATKPAVRQAAKSVPAKAVPAKSAPAAKAVAVKAAPAAKAAAAKAAGGQAPARKPVASKSVASRSVPGKSVPGKSVPGKAAALARRVGAAPAQPEWTVAELAGIRRELAGDVVVMQTEYDRSIHDITDLQKSSTDGAGDDQADAGSKTFEREQELSIAANRLDLLTQITRAVERIDAGTYGFCESCGQPIPKARLKAFPMATLDVECKQREERR